jgi:hypothetical protein
MNKIILAFSLLFVGLGASAQETFEGVGIVLSQKDGVTHVERTLMGSPAESAGITSQERINSVDGASIVGLDIQTVVNKIRGPAGTLVTLTMADDQNLREHNVSMIRVRFVLDCFIEGAYNLTIRGTSVSGNIGSQFVHWIINGNFIFGQFNGESLNLQYETNGVSAAIIGAIHNQSIMWTGANSNFVGYQSCIQ